MKCGINHEARGPEPVLTRHPARVGNSIIGFARVQYTSAHVMQRPVPTRKIFRLPLVVDLQVRTGGYRARPGPAAGGGPVPDRAAGRLAVTAVSRAVRWYATAAAHVSTLVRNSDRPWKLKQPSRSPAAGGSRPPAPARGPACHAMIRADNPMICSRSVTWVTGQLQCQASLTCNSKS